MALSRCWIGTVRVALDAGMEIRLIQRLVAKLWPIDGHE
jgi:hypothetical protein